MKLLMWLKKEWVQIIILAVPYCAAALLWDRLPAKLPIHWNYRGEVDGYAGKVFGTLFLPSVGVVMALLLPLLRRLDPKCRNYDEETKASIAGVFRTSRLAISLFMTVISLATLAVAMNVPVNISRVVTGGMGVLFIVLGNCMGRLRPNYFAGFRTPWSLESRTVWLKTHRLGGRLMMLCGAGVLVESFVLPVPVLIFAAVIPVLILVGIVPAVYSYFSYRAERKAAGLPH